MTLRTIIACDRCNLQRILSIELRRGIRDTLASVEDYLIHAHA